MSILPTKISAESVIETVFKTENKFLMQEFIDGGKRDVRAIVVGDQVVASMERKAKGGDFRANISLGAAANPIDLSGEEIKFSLKAAKAVGLPVCGVDFMRGKDGKLYLIECNSNFGLGSIEKATGVDVAGKMIEYVVANWENQPAKVGKVSPNKRKFIVRPKPSNELQIFKEDPYLKQVFQRARGKEVSYLDRDLVKHQVIIEAPSDLYRVMVESFIVE